MEKVMVEKTPPPSPSGTSLPVCCLHLEGTLAPLRLFSPTPPWGSPVFLYLLTDHFHIVKAFRTADVIHQHVGIRVPQPSALEV